MSFFNLAPEFTCAATANEATRSEFKITIRIKAEPHEQARGQDAPRLGSVLTELFVIAADEFGKLVGNWIAVDGNERFR